MKALTESKPGGAIPQVNNMPHQQTLSRMARCRQTLRRWWPFYVMALPGVIYFLSGTIYPFGKPKLRLSSTVLSRRISGSGCSILPR